ncbi:iron chelate uptake ABC transporter family permease subunit [Motilimonas eburnea]|uniref:iron chelate uptake ABC transporter family permease subunit n=1 Tax=Motilimonas eburnea TaxID=1737488 RepID=UPI001E5E930C|nr:iron chelate uptake ABC transporter family permease subunit [Motilimonas eburnea]MCE2570293.1 iron chelate uptake ABC transporter family permease subunit [Motilimonas eburnea]
MPDSARLLVLLAFSLGLVILTVALGLTADNYAYFLSKRIPRLLAIILAGVAIAQASFVFQTITQNRILTPSIMGFDALYVTTQVLLVLMFGSLSHLVVNPYINFVIATTSMVAFAVILYRFYFNRPHRNLITLLLVGLVFGQLFASISSFLSLLMDPTTFAMVQAKLFASFNNVQTDLVYLCSPVLIGVSLLLFRLHPSLDVLLLDQDNATSLGVDVAKLTHQIFILSAIAIAVATALVGPIMFFGLLVTNLSRALLQSYQHKVQLQGSALIAICSLLAGQWIVENVFTFATTLSVLFNLLGGSYFIYLLIRNRVA